MRERRDTVALPVGQIYHTYGTRSAACLLIGEKLQRPLRDPTRPPSRLHWTTHRDPCRIVRTSELPLTQPDL